MSQSSETARDRELLAQLDDETARLLFPEHFVEPLRVTLVFPPLEDPAAAAGTELQDWRDESLPGAPRFQRATFTLAQVAALYDFFRRLESVYAPQEVRVLLNDRQVPMVRELWLPLFWSLL